MTHDDPLVPGRAQRRGRRRVVSRLAAASAAVVVAATSATAAVASTASTAVDTQTRVVQPQLSKASTPAQAAVAADLSAATPKITWGGCPAGWGDPQSADGVEPRVTFSCATAQVPLDYDKPNGTQIRIALRRIAALDQKNKIGTLFFNPGGPGGSGVDFSDSAWALVTPEVRQKFDLVGFDPRGIARSAPAVCFKSFQDVRRTATSPTLESFPITRAQYRESVSVSRRISAKCRAQGNAIMRHMSTANVVRDLEMLRRGVGDKAGLNFAGYSYGTMIGSTYAAMFPNNFRALIVDGVLDPVEWSGVTGPERRQPVTYRVDSHRGSANALKQFYQQCKLAGPSRCALASQGDPEKIVRSLFALTKKEPVRVSILGMVLELGYQDLTGAVLGTLTAPVGWDGTAAILAMAAHQAGLAKAPKLPPGIQSTEISSLAKEAFAGARMPQTLEGMPGVLCTDANTSRNSETYWQYGRRGDRETNSYFGSSWVWGGEQCASWPFRDDDRWVGPYKRMTRKPVLVIGTLYDPSTDYGGAQAVAKNLPNSRLLTVAGWGHTSLGASACAQQWSSQYILTGALPPKGGVCRPNSSPFGGGNVASADSARMKAVLKAQKMVVANTLGRS